MSLQKQRQRVRNVKHAVVVTIQLAMPDMCKYEAATLSKLDKKLALSNVNLDKTG
jgi:hypothetical protein